MKISSKKIHSLMRTKLMTQCTLAEKSGISRATVNSALLKGSCNVQTVTKIAKALGVDPEEIIDKGE